MCLGTRNYKEVFSSWNVLSPQHSENNISNISRVKSYKLFRLPQFKSWKSWQNCIHRGSLLILLVSMKEEWRMEWNIQLNLKCCRDSIFTTHHNLVMETSNPWQGKVVFCWTFLSRYLFFIQDTRRFQTIHFKILNISDPMH